MSNPWEEIPLDAYENHMKLDSVMQLQAMNSMMKEQFDRYPADSVIILGIAGGNGLEHINARKFRKVYGIDINSGFLETVGKRYSQLSEILECICLNIVEEAYKLPKAELLIANLLIEYIGYDCFKVTVKQVKPKYVSCIIQVNISDAWVSDSPYIHVFDDLESVHYQINENELIKTMENIEYKFTERAEYSLPNGKKLVRLDFT